tara:strand:- start:338 stop:802 length:465 start_codon:yes stop_codon:yes gene_type:complete
MKIYKKVLITGGAQRIGMSIARHLSKNGFDIAVQYNNSTANVEKLRKSLDKSSNFMAFQQDFSKNNNFENFFKLIKKKFGKIDVLINNASAFEFDTVKTTSYEIFDKHIDVNLKTPFFLSKCFVENLKNNNGLIINIIDQRVKNITTLFYFIHN